MSQIVVDENLLQTTKPDITSDDDLFDFDVDAVVTLIFSQGQNSAFFKNKSRFKVDFWNFKSTPKQSPKSTWKVDSHPWTVWSQGRAGPGDHGKVDKATSTI